LYTLLECLAALLHQLQHLLQLIAVLLHQLQHLLQLIAVLLQCIAEMVSDLPRKHHLQGLWGGCGYFVMRETSPIDNVLIHFILDNCFN